MQPVKSVGRFLPTLFLLCIVFYIFTDPQGAAVAFKWAFQTAAAGAQHFAEFIRAVAK
ncbi:hypothetical protein [Nonomuraea sp. SBT364]|uniref:hypothetical protein n=1 Tax=Nonomuraea sp. SBT364 TaxID=1580530 RepID=UPI000AC0ED0F|nr:hypothetical protein [Nonomuraea sp. SBT364]